MGALDDTLDLVLATKARTARHLAVGGGAEKGNLLLSMSEAAFVRPSLRGALDALAALSSDLDRRWDAVAPWQRPGASADASVHRP